MGTRVARNFVLPVPVEWWTEKLNRNKARDARVREELRAMGWNTMVIWECQLKPKERQATLENVVRLLEKTYVESTIMRSYPSYPLLEEEELPKWRKKRYPMRVLIIINSPTGTYNPSYF